MHERLSVCAEEGGCVSVHICIGGLRVWGPCLTIKKMTRVSQRRKGMMIAGVMVICS
jgi:hypothetical protein